MGPFIRQAQRLGFLAAIVACAGLAGCGTTAAPAAGAGSDAGKPDSSASDSSALDSSALDTALDVTAADAAPDGDTGPVDAAADAPDGKYPTKEQLCDNYANQYKAQLPAVDACARDSDCGVQAPDALLCGCGHFTNLGAAKWADLQQTLQDFNSHKCSTGFCGSVQCTDLSTSIGVCAAGKCQAKAVKCADLEAAWNSLKSDVQKCTGPADCKATLGVAVGCAACMVPASIALLADGSPQAQYAALLKKQWNDQNCAPDPPPCACGPVTQTDCVAGVCQVK